MDDLPETNANRSELVKILLVIGCAAILSARLYFVCKYKANWREPVLIGSVALMVFGPPVMVCVPNALAWTIWLFGWACVFIGFRFSGDMGADQGMFLEPLLTITAIWNSIVGMAALKYRDKVRSLFRRNHPK